MSLGSPVRERTGADSSFPALGGGAELKRRRKGGLQRRSQRLAYVLLAPLVVFIGVLVLYPVGITTVEAFFRVDPLDPPTRFIGLGNFRAVFAMQGIVQSFENTGVYVLVGVTLSTLIGLAMALLLRRYSRWRAPILCVVVLPWALPAVVEALFWSRIYDPSSGALNGILTSLHVISNYRVWLGGDQWLAIVLIELVQVWQITPLTMLLILAALQLIPHDLTEAASCDGAGPWGLFWRITLPLIRPGITIAMVAAVTSCLNVFDQPYILGGTATTTASVGVETYVVSFQNLAFGQGYALSLLMTVATAAASLVIMRLVYRRVTF